MVPANGLGKLENKEESFFLSVPTYQPVSIFKANFTVSTTRK